MMPEIDPVCGMTVTEASPHSCKLGDRTYHFCGAHCRETFLADPDRYLQSPSVPEVHKVEDQAKPQPAGEAQEYTCPMHPEVVRRQPGSCPICGMALEPKTATSAEERPNPELTDMTRRFWVSLVLTVPLLAIAMLDMLPGEPMHRLFGPRLNWIELALATPVVLWGGWPFFQRGWRSIVSRRLNMFTLIAIGTGVAYAESVAATLLPGIFPASFRTGTAARWPCTSRPAAVIVTLVLLGQVLELRARASHGQRHPRPAGPGPEDRPSDCSTTEAEKDVPLDQIRDGRPAARPARRKGARRRRPVGRQRCRSTSR